MRIVLAPIAFAAAALAFPASAAASQSASAQGLADIRAPAGINVIRDIMTQTNLSFTVVGQPGDTVALGIPGSINVVSGAGESLTLNTTTSQLQLASTVLAQDTVSISVGAEFDGQAGDADSGQYNGVIVVLAQYN